jgi:hypothetical protein
VALQGILRLLDLMRLFRQLILVFLHRDVFQSIIGSSVPLPLGYEFWWRHASDHVEASLALNHYWWRHLARSDVDIEWSGVTSLLRSVSRVRQHAHIERATLREVGIRERTIFEKVGQYSGIRMRIVLITDSHGQGMGEEMSKVDDTLEVLTVFRY